MGLVTSSFSVSSSDVKHYGNTGTAYIANWYTINEADGTNQETVYIKSRVKIKTDEAGAKKISFTMSGRSGYSNAQTLNGKAYWSVSTSSSQPSSGKAITLAASNPTASGSITMNMMPNTTYYVWFWYEGWIHSYNGTLRFTTTGTYGAPGEITANDSDFNNNDGVDTSSVEMSYGSATAGATYTVGVTVGENAEVELMNHQDSGADVSTMTWIPYYDDYADDYPNDASLPCVIRVETWFGTTKAGEKTKTITLSFTQEQVGIAHVDPEDPNPVFSIAPYNEVPISASKYAPYYVQGYSKIGTAIDDSELDLKNNATITKWSISVGNNAPVDIQWVDSSPTRAWNSEVIGATTPVTLTVTDSRGFTITESYTATITPYRFPSITINEADIFRCDSGGNPDDSGTYLSATLSATYASIANQNDIELQILKTKAGDPYGAGVDLEYGTTTSSGTDKIYTWSGHNISGLTDVTWNIKFVATDDLGNKDEYELKLESQLWALHLRHITIPGEGGDPDVEKVGAAFGKAVERYEELDIGDWKITCGAISSILQVDIASFSTLPKTINDDSITAEHIVLRDEIGNPDAVDGEWTVTTTDGSLTISGTITGSTTLRLILAIPGTEVT